MIANSMLKKENVSYLKLSPFNIQSSFQLIQKLSGRKIETHQLIQLPPKFDEAQDVRNAYEHIHYMLGGHPIILNMFASYLSTYSINHIYYEQLNFSPIQDLSLTN
jgi:hypothetical protein